MEQKKQKYMEDIQIEQRQKQIDENVYDINRGFDVIDKTLDEFDIPQTPDVVKEFGMFDVNEKILQLLGDRDNKINNLIGFTDNTPINVQAKIIGERLPVNPIIRQQISPEEKLRRMLEW